MIKTHKNLEIFRQNDKNSAAAEAGEYLNAALAENKKSPILLLLSGGSALNILEYVGESALGANLSITMLDERFSEDANINNFAQLQKSDFYKDAFNVEASFFGTLPRPGETAENLRTRWDKNFKNWREENPTGLIIATLGMGADGHTAGIFSFPEDPDKFQKLFLSENWTVAYNTDNKNKFPERLTTTLTFLKLIDFGFAYVCGADKKDKLDKLTSANIKTAELPAAVWREMKNVKVFTDIS